MPILTAPDNVMCQPNGIVGRIETTFIQCRLQSGKLMANGGYELDYSIADIRKRPELAQNC